ncbi:MAG: peptidylprolyl isomerase [Bacillota bacterium]|nr:peptidylprolyl isomerase [Bacillota bacterium]
MQGKKTKVILAIVSAIIIISVGVTIYFISSSKKSSTAPTPSDSSKDAFGYHALKFNGEYVSTDIFSEERNNFFEKWSRNAEMMYKTDEERNDMLLDEIIKRLVIEYYVNNKASVQVTKAEVDDYIKKYIETAYAQEGGVQAYMDGMGFKTKDDMIKNTEFYIKRLRYFSKIATQYGVSISDSDFEKQYADHKIKNTQAFGKRIHISSKSRGDQAALQLAQDIYNKIKNGEDFAKLAKEKSEDDETKSSGGVMQYITGGIYSKDFDKAVFSAKPGQLLPPISNMSGYDVVYVQKIVDFYHPKDEYKDILLMQKFGESDKLNSWLEVAKKSVTIEITDPAFKAYREFKSKDLKNAATHYKEAFDKTKYEMFLQKAAECYKSLGNWDKVIELNDIGIDTNPEQLEYSINKAEGLYKNQKKDEALKLLKETEAKASDNSYFKQLIMQMYKNLGLTDEADRIQKEIKVPESSPATSTKNK